MSALEESVHELIRGDYCCAFQKWMEVVEEEERKEVQEQQQRVGGEPANTTSATSSADADATSRSTHTGKTSAGTKRTSSTAVGASKLSSVTTWTDRSEELQAANSNASVPTTSTGSNDTYSAQCVLTYIHAAVASLRCLVTWAY